MVGISSCLGDSGLGSLKESRRKSVKEKSRESGREVGKLDLLAEGIERRGCIPERVSLGVEGPCGACVCVLKKEKE